MATTTPEPCKLHDMYWCALCNGDAKKFEDSLENKLPTFRGLLEKGTKK